MTKFLIFLLIFLILSIIILLFWQKYKRKQFELDLAYLTRHEKNHNHLQKLEKPKGVSLKPVFSKVRELSHIILEKQKIKEEVILEKNKYRSNKRAEKTKENAVDLDDLSQLPIFSELMESSASVKKVPLDFVDPFFSKNKKPQESKDYLFLETRKNEFNQEFNSSKNTTNVHPLTKPVHLVKENEDTTILHKGEEQWDLTKPKENLEVISIDNIGRFTSRRKKLNENDLGLQVKTQNKPSPDYEVIEIKESSQKKKLNSEINQYSSSINTGKKIIQPDEIKQNLLRLRDSRRREKPESNEKKPSQAIIQHEEVIANLAGTDSPFNKSRNRPVREAVKESVIPLSVRIHGNHTIPSNPPVINPIDTSPLYSRFTPFEEAKIEHSIVGMNHETAVIENKVPSVADHSINEIETLQAHHSNSYETHYPEINIQEKVPFDAHDLSQHQEPNIPFNERIEEKLVIEENQIHFPHINKVEEFIDSNDDYLMPPINLLQPADLNNNFQENQESLIEKGIKIEEKLAEFKVKVSVTDAFAGPVVTRYEIEPSVGVRGSQVINLEKDLARALGCASIRIVDTIPGKTCMGLELPNVKRKMIRLSEIVGSNVFRQNKSKLTIALGYDITGSPVVTDLAKAPHLLVAGTTGSGKSVGINAMILSILFKATPEEVRMIMIDPKMLELSIYEGIPHLLAPVVTDMKLAPNALIWCVNEMEKRYRLMSHLGVRNLIGYNQVIKDAKVKGDRIANPFSITPDNPDLLETMPYIVVVVDEFADLMMTTGKKIEELIARLAQKARAAGIHLILATQRPSVDVITGLIKANIPTRVAFQVSSKVDSRTIIDQMGAESLLGLGDMLFLPPGSGYPQRIHGAFVADEEVHQVVDYLKKNGEPHYIDDIINGGVGEEDLFSNANSSKSNDGESDPLYDEAVSIVLNNKKASISYVQRHLRIGYNRAARLIEQMESSGIVSAPESNGNRRILVNTSNELN